MDLFFSSSLIFFMRSSCATVVLSILLMTCLFSSVQPLCHSHERRALLQFKDTFVINRSASGETWSYPKTATWGSSDCCLWDGVECDNATGHLVALDLSSSYLYGDINSSSSLFQLSQLQFLSLADNDFNYSQIPSGFSNLSRLVYLDLSYSAFMGQIPSDISQLGKLEYLDLADAYVKSQVPRFLGNLSSLVTLGLEHCYLYGGFPDFLLRIPNLQVLDLEINMHLSGPLPEFQPGSSLRKLLLFYTSFSGSIPASIGELKFLNKLDVDQCELSGLLPSSLGKLTRLAYLGLSSNNFIGQIPSFLQNLTHLTELWLDGNQLTGRIPPWLTNLTKLTELSLGGNKLKGHVPRSFSRLVNLEALLLSRNGLSGTIDLDMLFDLKNLTILQLSDNKFSVMPETTSSNATVSKFEVLLLGSCNLRKFPNFLRYQNKLEVLDLSKNHIAGQIPNWVWNISTKSMLNLDLSGNSLTGFDKLSPLVTLPWVNLASMDLSENMLKGPVPVPPLSIVTYDVSNNTLSGEISPLFCNISSPALLDLSNNQLTGFLPKCLDKLSNSLSVLNMKWNYFQGTIPEMCTNGSNLMAIDLSHNHLQGPLPRSFAKCIALVVLSLGNNQLLDGFPSWLGILPELRLLILPRNLFHGTIKETISGSEFLNLRVIDLSQNGFTGPLPSEYFKKWSAMKQVDSNSSYLAGNFSYYQGNIPFIQYHSYSMTIMNKGIDVFYGKIQGVFVAIDLSSNKFEGAIPDCIGSLQGLQVLNLSNNILSGGIPPSLGSVTHLESLDLSRNNISGRIPQQLVQLTFLSFFNVSYNHLIGPIPHGNQLNTFENSSYVGNSGLCGDPLTKRCENSKPAITTNSSFEERDSRSWFESNWMVVLFGYLGGLVVGVVIEHTVTWKHDWTRMILWLRYLKRRVL